MQDLNCSAFFPCFDDLSICNYLFEAEKLIKESEIDGDNADYFERVAISKIVPGSTLSGNRGIFDFFLSGVSTLIITSPNFSSVIKILSYDKRGKMAERAILRTLHFYLKGSLQVRDAIVSAVRNSESIWCRASFSLSVIL